MKLSVLTAAALAGAAAFAVSPAMAGNTIASNTIHVGLVVVDDCTIDAPTDINFGQTGIVETDITQTADITVECTSETPYSIGLSKGAGTDADHRVMTNAANDTINYGLYSDSSHLTNWGNTVGTDTVNSAGASAVPETHTIHAIVPAHQNVPIGTYSDTITATIWYAGDASH